jgi:hypothetical protein
VNAVMTFPVILLIWLGLTVVAAIAGSIAHRFPRTLGKESRTALGHCYTAPGGSWCARLAVRVLACAPGAYGNGHASEWITVHVDGPAPMP